MNARESSLYSATPLFLTLLFQFCSRFLSLVVFPSQAIWQQRHFSWTKQNGCI
jgi:hypothetical protein